MIKLTNFVSGDILKESVTNGYFLWLISKMDKESEKMTLSLCRATSPSEIAIGDKFNVNINKNMDADITFFGRIEDHPELEL